VRWYLEHHAWVARVTSGEYQHWLNKNYHERGEELA
jgi:dTDP-glucose 4,6-dehydratase